LKFALLYFDQLQPIVPFSYEKYISDTTREIVDSTDLIKFYRPKYETGFRATLDAIETCETILRHPFAFKDLFKYSNVIEAWRYTENHNYTIFRDKYIDEWERFVIDNGLGSHSRDGIAVSKHLGYIYMTLLAQAIGAASEISPVTDRPELDKFAIFCTQTSPASNESINVANYAINLLVPSDLTEISFKKIIELRNKNGFRKRLNSFQNEIELCISSFENGSTARSEIVKRFIERRGSFLGDISDNLLTLGFGAVTASIGIWLAIDANNFDTYNYIKEMSGAAGLSVSSILAIRKSWHHTKTRRYTRRYITDIQGLHSAL
jgi:hypothetical protein